ncbi:GNAT family N-acetyltransferase [Nocardioides euryhalodurans]|uniref:GNAT family N-acetyltransferase n=1 Tax=Nocardioides euryhalodurans TaxID=2518370 RepID=A0A4P7GH72_9ACTN|nr:GNAT family N-acetyltransferase [Nocardioides euryhalodurans]QBR91195.1 GNAT family N-acetyltransferase [Nocardioides euryhalodurans]
MSGAQTLTVRRLGVDDEPEVLDLLTTAMAGGPTGSRTSDFFRWKHRDSPFGASPGLVATDGDRIVGVRLFLRWELQLGDARLRAVRAVDTATHPDYQRRGIFKTLTLQLLDQLEREEGIALVFNTPNADSRPGYLRMGWQEVGQLPVRISPVRPLRFLRGARAASAANASGSASAVAPATDVRPVRSPLPTAAEVLAHEDEVAALLGRGAVPGRLHTPITPAYLRWRYAAPPGLDYRAVAVRRHGELVGLGVGRVRSRAGLAELTLGDVMVAAGDTGAARAVLRAARRAGVDHVALHASPGSEVARAALAAGYLPAPGGGIGLVANPRPGCPPDVLDSRSWRLSLGDLEVF